MKTQTLSFLTTLGVLGFSSSLPAAPSFYAGVQGGYSYAHVKMDAHHYYGAGLQPYDTNKKFGEGSFQAGFILGGDCAWYKKKIALGLQLLGDWGTANETTEWGHSGFPDIPLNISIRKPFTLTPAVTVAYLIKPSLRAFLSLGASISQFKIRTYNGEDRITKKETPTKVGFAPSLGMEYRFSPRWSVIGLVGLEHYNFLKFSQSMFDDPGYPQELLSLRIKPRYVNGKIGVLLRFGKR